MALQGARPGYRQGIYLAGGAHVVATVSGSRHAALHELLSAFAGQLEIEEVDIAVPGQVDSLHRRLGTRRFDLLFVIAGVVNNPAETPGDIATEEFSRLMIANALSPMRVIETLVDLLPPTGILAVMSSGQGSIADNNTGGFEIYRASKSALNQLMRSYAACHRYDPRTLLLMAPGWVMTELGGPNARLTGEESTPVWSKQWKPNAGWPASSTWTTWAAPSPRESARRPSAPSRSPAPRDPGLH